MTSSLTSRFLPASLPVLLVLLFGCPKKPITTAPAPEAPTVVTAPSEAPPPAAPPVDVPAAASVDALVEDVGPVDPFKPEDRKQLDDAVAMLTTKDANKAQQAFDRLSALVASYGDQATVHYNIGVAWQIQGDEAKARAAWLRATEIDPAFDKAWLNLGLISQNSGRVDLALASFQSGLRYNARSVELQVATINNLRKQKRYDEAIAQAKAALSVNSRSIPLFCNLAMVYIETNELALAGFMLKKANTDLNGDSSAELHATLGQVYYLKKDSGNAKAEWEKALVIDPFQMAALQYLGSYFLDNRAYEDAQPLWERAVGRAPKDPTIRINLGICYRGLGARLAERQDAVGAKAKYDAAKKEYETALTLDGKNPEPWRNLGVLYGDYEKDYDGALNAISQYRAAGGGPVADLDLWVASIQKIKAKAEKDKAREEARKKREAADAAQEATDAALAAEAALNAAAEAAAAGQPVAPAPDGTVPPDGAAAPEGTVAPAPADPVPAPEPARPQPEPTNPWGEK